MTRHTKRRGNGGVSSSLPLGSGRNVKSAILEWVRSVISREWGIKRGAHEVIRNG